MTNPVARRARDLRVGDVIQYPGGTHQQIAAIRTHRPHWMGPGPECLEFSFVSGWAPAHYNPNSVINVVMP